MTSSFDPSYITELGEMLRSDPEWQVRAAAATALGQMRPAHDKAGPILIEVLKKEKDRLLKKLVVDALGACQYPEAVPILINALDVPDRDLPERVMVALYRIQYQGWDNDRAVQEMDAAGFGFTRVDRRRLKQFVSTYRRDPSRAMDRGGLAKSDETSALRDGR